MHKDHARTYQIVQDAVFYAALRTIERPLPRHGIRSIYHADNREDQQDYVPDVVVAIDPESFEAWRQCCSAYQLFRGGVSNFRYREYYEALAITRGWEAFTQRANAFKL
jgi:LmbE family N-acetylglucosaminyl deacetylase